MKKAIFLIISLILAIIFIQTFTFKFPKKEGFIFKTDVENPNLKCNDKLVINCELTNKTGENYDIEFGADIITYEDEIVISIGQIGKFNSNESKYRKIEITTDKKGIDYLRIYAKFNVINPYTKERQEYNYTDRIKYNVY